MFSLSCTVFFFDKINNGTVLLFQTKSQAEDSMDLLIMPASAVSVSALTPFEYSTS